jgi:hypothetical protein
MQSGGHDVIPLVGDGDGIMPKRKVYVEQCPVPHCSGGTDGSAHRIPLDKLTAHYIPQQLIDELSDDEDFCCCYHCKYIWRQSKEKLWELERGFWDIYRAVGQTKHLCRFQELGRAPRRAIIVLSVFRLNHRAVEMIDEFSNGRKVRGGDESYAPELDYALSMDAGPGEHTIAVCVQDEYENLATDKAVVK